MKSLKEIEMKPILYSSDFEEFLKTIDILYVEDEDRVRELIEARLSRHFGTIHTASNGEVGLYKYDIHRPKIVITDIRMPVMDGLEMLEAIKDKNHNVKAIITTAHTDVEFLMKSIDIGIDKYIPKPINTDGLVEATKKIAFYLYNENITKEHQMRSMETQVGGVITSMFEQMSRSIPNPMILYSSGKPIFMNKAFVALFNAQIIGWISAGESKLEDILGMKISPKSKLMKTTILLPSGRKKIFNISKTLIHLDDEADTLLYMFNDLTMLEYQNAKLKSYTDTLYDLLRARSRASDESEQNRVTNQVNIKEATTAKSVATLLSGTEMEALKRSHSVKSMAIDYVKEIADDLIDDLAELSEIEIEISDIIDIFENNDRKGSFTELGNRFIAYSKTIDRLLEFEDLALAVKNFGLFLIAANGNEEIRWQKLLSYAQNIKLDLVSWRHTIFVEQSALDIHYLDSSLLSSCVQAQINSGQDATYIEDENDLELF